MNRTKFPRAARHTHPVPGWPGAMGLVLGLASGNCLAADGILPFSAHEGFEAPCNRGEVLTGIYLRNDGVALAAISPRCAIASKPAVKNPAPPDRWYGRDPDPGLPGAATTGCRDIAPVLLSIRVTTVTDTTIGYFHLLKLETFCGVDGSHPSLEHAGGSYLIPGAPGELAVGTQFCPAGQVAVGMRGRSNGVELVQLGLMCGDPRTGSRGVQDVTRAPSNVGGGAATSAASRAGRQPGIVNSLQVAPGAPAQNKPAAATVNPQPLPPRTSPGAITLSPQSLGSNTISGAPALAAKAPAPKPSSSAASLHAQPLPGGPPQAPGSLR